MSDHDADTVWTTVIRPESPWFDLRLGELWSYRDLVMLMVQRDFVAQYKQTILGPLWHVIQPLLTTITFTVVFGRIAQIPTDSLPPFLFYLSGTVLWGYFSNSFTKTSNTFVANANVFGKVYFPRLAVPVSTLGSSMIGFFVQFTIFLGFLLWFMARGAPVDPNAWVLATPLLLLLMAGLGMGGGVILSALTTRYRDLTNVVAFGVSLFMYMTPVVYPLSTVPERYRIIVLANPLTPIVEAFRFAFLGVGTVSASHLAYTAVFTAALLLCGILIFNRIERTFMDTV
ncbi:MAG TPA: ABC transporter permease [Longimicrobiales bacterium]|nr:ABC transporter permease [Longimicrobiales bacterium]